MDEENHKYFFTPPARDGEIVVTVETYSDNIVPSKCKDDYEGTPLLSINVYKSNPNKTKKFYRIAT